MVIRTAGLALLLSMGATAHADCPADLDGSGQVGGGDIGVLLALWTG